jgi:hypothetical protein
MVSKSVSLDEYELIAALIFDVSNIDGLVFNTRAARLTVKYVERRYAKEGIGFLTKALPRLAKALDKTLAGNDPFDCVKLGFQAKPGTKLPRFLGEFFERILALDGSILPCPCPDSVKVIRQICYLYYKYELPYTDEQEQEVVSQFEKTEEDLLSHSTVLASVCKNLVDSTSSRAAIITAAPIVQVARKARIWLSRALCGLDCRDITPRHGPGAVATKQRLWDKYDWSNVSDRITSVYPLDEYFYASLGAVCDQYESFSKIRTESLPARVVLVPKDSRGPRLISCEPVDFQWIQQGLSSAIVRHVEHSRITKYNVFFTDQSHNQIGALYGSQNGRYATLDLKEASDRVSVDLVRLLFPEHVYTYLESCRSLSTVLPGGKELKLRKFAPMGSALCFPVMALTIWALLTAAAPNRYTRERILVYGDDVVVPTNFVETAMSTLESFGLKINRDKSCYQGFFRESCGLDAFKGVKVTPVRIRTVWTSSPSPNSYSSWVAYANSMWDMKYYGAYDYIVSRLLSLYGNIPSTEQRLSCPSLRSVPEERSKLRRRWNSNLQKFEYRVLDVVTKPVRHEMNGWSMLLRYFVEAGRPAQSSHGCTQGSATLCSVEEPFSVRTYTRRKASILALRWR